MKADPPLPTVSTTDVLALGAQSLAAAKASPLPVGRGAGVQFLLEVRAKSDGTADLVDARTGRLVSPCATPAIARRTRDFFR